MDMLWRELRFALRSLGKSPLFTGIAVLSLALGIGANTAVFTLTDQLLVRLLPVQNPKELVQIRVTGGRIGSNHGDGIHTLAHPLYLDLRDRNTVLTGLMARYATLVSVSTEGTELAGAELVSGNYFDVLGVKAAAGRLFTLDDDRNPGGHPLTVLSYRYWQDRFGGRTDVIGSVVKVNNVPLTVIGVSQEGFDGIDPGVSASLRIPITMKAQMTPTWDELRNRRYAWLQAFGRLKPGVTREQASASMQVLFKQIQQEELKEPFFSQVPSWVHEKFLNLKFELIPAARGQSQFRNRAERPLRVLSFVVGLVLLIACANLASLLLARAAMRQKEIALRFSLGATRWQVVRQLQVESALLAGAGAIAGLAVGAWSCRALLGFLPRGVTTITLSPVPDIRVLLYTAVVAAVTVLLFGLVPAWRATAGDTAGALKQEAGSVAGGHGHVRIRKSLVAAQVGLALVLLIAAGLFARSLNNLKIIDPGFRIDRLITFTVNPSLNSYTPERRLQFFEQALEQIRALPGVRGVAVASNRLLTGGRWDSNVKVEGYTSKPNEDVNPYMNAVSPGYFEALGIPLLRGRDFRRSDSGDTAKVVVVNQKFVDYFFGGKEALGRRLAMGGGPNSQPDLEIVGIVGDSKYTSVREETPRQVFHPYMRFPARISAMTLSVRTAAEPEPMFASIRGVMRRLDPAVPVYDMRTLETQMNDSLANERLVSALSGVFSLLALVLAGIGLYGVLAYVVASRTKEIGIRMALGADRRVVVGMVMRELGVMVVFGAAAGLVTAWALGRLVTGLLYQVEPYDTVTLGGATVAIIAGAILCGLGPTMRATRVQPVLALRYE